MVVTNNKWVCGGGHIYPYMGYPELLELSVNNIHLISILIVLCPSMNMCVCVCVCVCVCAVGNWDIDRRKEGSRYNIVCPYVITRTCIHTHAHTQKA
jgi:hypothetical protein